MHNLALLADLDRRLGQVREAETIEAELRTLLAAAEDDYPLAVKLRSQTVHR
jgi:hypothetical protein